MIAAIKLAALVNPNSFRLYSLIKSFYILFLVIARDDDINVFNTLDFAPHRGICQFIVTHLRHR